MSGDSNAVFKFRLKYKNKTQLDTAVSKVKATRTLFVATKKEVPTGAKVEVMLNAAEPDNLDEDILLTGFCHAPSKSGYVCRIMAMPGLCGGQAAKAKSAARKPQSGGPSAPRLKRARGARPRQQSLGASLGSKVAEYRVGILMVVLFVTIVGMTRYITNQEQVEAPLVMPAAWQEVVNKNGLKHYSGATFLAKVSDE